MNASARIDLLRHGDTGHRSYRGQLDDPLLEIGWVQLREAVAGRDWDAVVSSPLQRCAHFADELATARRLPLRIEPLLIEYHFGHWQQMPMDTLATEHGEALGRFWSDPAAHPPPGAETFDAFARRLTRAVDDIVRLHAGQRVLVITHGGVIRLLRCLSAGRAYREMLGIDVPHASLHPLPWPSLSCVASVAS